MGDFKTQVAEVRVLPCHVQVLGELEITQLKWRYYESSANVDYDDENLNLTARNDVVNLDCLTQESFDSNGLIALTRSLEEVRYRVEGLEKLLLMHREMAERVSRRSISSTKQCDRLFMLMRQKLALASQRLLTGTKSRHEGTDISTVFDKSCADSLRITVDCTTEEFEMISSAVVDTCDSAYFRVDDRSTAVRPGALRASFDVAEILFESLSDLCKSIGVFRDSDLITIATRKAKLHGKRNSSEDAALMVCGTFLATDSEEKPSAILVCRSLHEGVDRGKKVSVLWRNSREFDSRTVWYRHQIERRDTCVSSLLHDIYFDENGENAQWQVQKKLPIPCQEARCFSIRFKPSTNPKPRIWSILMLPRANFVGTCELEVPYILLRGSHAVREVSSLIDEEYILPQTIGWSLVCDIRICRIQRNYLRLRINPLI